jgi:hypothetical protein
MGDTMREKSFYVATAWGNRAAAQQVCEYAESLGWVCTHKWWEVEDTVMPTAKDKQGWAVADRAAVFNADVLIYCKHENSQGALIELGMALACGIPVIAHGKYDINDRIVFLSLFEVKHSSTVDGLKYRLSCVGRERDAEAKEFALWNESLQGTSSEQLEFEWHRHNDPRNCTCADVAQCDQDARCEGVSEVRVTDPNTGGQKGQKLARFDLGIPEFDWALAELDGMGARKYDDRNWLKGYKWGLSVGALKRHLTSWLQGESYDVCSDECSPDCVEHTGAHHLVAAAWHARALFTFEVRGLGTDDVRSM